MIPLNVFAIVVVSLMLVGFGGTMGGFFYGNHIGKALERGDRMEDDALIEKVSKAAQLAAGEAIAGITVKHTTIRQQADKEIRENTIYRDCSHSDGMWRRINEAYGAVGARGGELPATQPASGQDIRGHDQRVADGGAAVRPMPNGGARKP